MSPQLEVFKLYFRHRERFVKKAKCNIDNAVLMNAMGGILLCFRLDMLGNIKNGAGIREIWYSDRANKDREKIVLCGNACHFLLNLLFEGDYPFGVE